MDRSDIFASPALSVANAAPAGIGRSRPAARAPWPWLTGLVALAACGAMDAANRPSLDAIQARMPEEIAGFRRGEAVQRPGPMLAIDYATSNRAAVATILVYATDTRAAPSDPTAPEIDREVSSAVAEVTEAPTGRTGRRLTERERFTIADPGLRCAVMSGAFGRAPVTRHVCVGAAHGRFVKIQVTMGSMRGTSPDAVAFAAGALRAVRGTAG